MSRLDMCVTQEGRMLVSQDSATTETWLETRVRPSNAESHVRDLLAKGFTGSITLHCSQGRVNQVHIRKRGVSITRP